MPGRNVIAGIGDAISGTGDLLANFAVEREKRDLVERQFTWEKEKEKDAKDFRDKYFSWQKGEALEGRIEKASDLLTQLSINQQMTAFSAEMDYKSKELGFKHEENMSAQNFRAIFDQFVLTTQANADQKSDEYRFLTKQAEDAYDRAKALAKMSAALNAGAEMDVGFYNAFSPIVVSMFDNAKVRKELAKGKDADPQVFQSIKNAMSLLSTIRSHAMKTPNSGATKKALGDDLYNSIIGKRPSPEVVSAFSKLSGDFLDFINPWSEEAPIVEPTPNPSETPPKTSTVKLPTLRIRLSEPKKSSSPEYRYTPLPAISRKPMPDFSGDLRKRTQAISDSLQARIDKLRSRRNE